MQPRHHLTGSYKNNAFCREPLERSCAHSGVLSSIACPWQLQAGLEMGDLETELGGRNSLGHVTL